MRRAALAGLLALLAAPALGFHWNIVRFPHPLDPFEPAQPYLASHPAGYPLSINVYGWAHSTLMGALHARDFKSQRAMSALFLFACLALQALVMRRAGLKLPESACLLLASYHGLLANVTPLARPDALGMALTLAGLTIPYLLSYRSWSLLLAAALFSLAAASKLYFLLGPLMLGSWLLLRRQWRQAALFGAAFVLATLAWILSQRDSYLYQTFLFNYNAKSYSTLYMRQQLAAYVAAMPIAAVLPLLGLDLLLRGRLKGLEGREWWLYSGIGLLAFVYLMGGHFGAWMTYAFQLIGLPLIPALAALIAAMPGARRKWILPLLLANLAFSWRALPRAHFSSPMAPWTQAKQWLEGSKRPFVQAELNHVLPPGAAPVDSAFSAHHPLVSKAPPQLQKYFPDTTALKAKGDAYFSGLQAALERGDFDRVILREGSKPYEAIARRRYRLADQLRLPYPPLYGGSKILVFVRKRQVN